MAKTTEKLTFEQALERLEKIVEQIESGQVGLEESIARYEEGIKLVKQCREILDAAEKKIQVLARGEAGQLVPDGKVEPPPEEEGEEEIPA